MKSTTINRKAYVAGFTMVATMLLLLGSFAVSKSARDTNAFADQATDSTVPRSTTTVPASAQKFTVLPAKSEFPAMKPTMEQELLAAVPNDGQTWIVIPRLHLRMQIVNGVTNDRLALGVGWYTQTKKPGKKGNIGLAGHRTTFPAPFFFLDKIRVADSVILIVDNELHRYEVQANDLGEPYDVVQPDINIRVLADRGFDSLTLTTCTPIGTVEERLIVHAKLMKRIPFER
jgi:LPXTG-site transpeptidase (sortase) family protein